MIALGNPQSKGVQFDVTIPNYIPPQPLEFIEPTTGKKKVFTIDNAQKLADLIQQGYNLVQQIKGGTGQRKVVVVTSESDPKPTKAGFSKIALIVGGLLAAGTLFYTLKNR
jgi:hypothetical protein